jgi:hypothetical protein
MFPDFMTVTPSGERPPNWDQIRDEAWEKVFSFFAERLQPAMP